MNIFDQAIDSLGEGILNTQVNNITNAWVLDGHLNKADQPAANKGLELLVGVFFSMLAEGQEVKNG